MTTKECAHITNVGANIDAKVVPLRLYDMQTPQRFVQWAQIIELILAIEPDPTLAMNWFAREGIEELGGFTGFELMRTHRIEELHCFLRSIVEGVRG